MPRTPLMVDLTPEEREWLHQSARYLGTSTAALVRMCCAITVPALLQRSGVRWNRIERRWENIAPTLDPPEGQNQGSSPTCAPPGAQEGQVSPTGAQDDMLSSAAQGGQDEAGDSLFQPFAL